MVNFETPQSIDEIITYILDEEKKEEKRLLKSRAQAEERELRKSIKLDITNVYNALMEQLNGIQNMLNAVLKSSDKLLENAGAVATTTKELAFKIGKITDTADKIATDTSKYHNTVLSRPAQTNRSYTDPKVLGDMECKAKQILIEIYDTEGNNTLGKSLTDLLTKANETIRAIKDSDKPKEAKVEAVFKTHKKVLVIILNSKETACWIKQPEIEVAFTKHSWKARTSASENTT
jgi:hypothetical protein